MAGLGDLCLWDGIVTLIERARGSLLGWFVPLYNVKTQLQGTSLKDESQTSPNSKSVGVLTLDSRIVISIIF